MSLIVYTTEQAEEWDRIVCSFEDYDVYFMCGYVKAFKQHGDGEPMLFYYESKNSSLRGINVVMKRDIANDERFRGNLQLINGLILLRHMDTAGGCLRARVIGWSCSVPMMPGVGNTIL
ncbi:MAG: hypothetical protein ACLSFC_00560 [Enterocloster bolteae]